MHLLLFPFILKRRFPSGNIIPVFQTFNYLIKFFFLPYINSIVFYRFAEIFPLLFTYLSKFLLLLCRVSRFGDWALCRWHLEVSIYDSNFPWNYRSSIIRHPAGVLAFWRSDILLFFRRRSRSHVNGEFRGAHSRDWVTPLRELCVIVTKLPSHGTGVISHVTGDRSHVTAKFTKLRLTYIYIITTTLFILS